MKDPIIIVAGEPNSIFLEIFFKSYKKIKVKSPLVLIVSKDLFLSQMKKLNYNFKINIINKKSFNLNLINKNVLNIIDINLKFKKTFNKISKHSKPYIKESFSIALKIIKKYKLKYLINGPISKKSFLEKKYLGITEYLSHKTKTLNKEVMLIYTNKISVSPVTTHDPLKKIFRKLNTKKIIKNIITINNFYKKKLNKNVRFAVTGLNPHCETKDKFNEEKKIIEPAIKMLKKRRITITGPYAADTVFLKQNLKKFDVIIGMYHDQVLTPIKTIYGFEPINITLGLPFLRISPDHGPNHKMIGKNISDPSSLMQALKFINKVNN